MWRWQNVVGREPRASMKAAGKWLLPHSSWLRRATLDKENLGDPGWMGRLGYSGALELAALWSPWNFTSHCCPLLVVGWLQCPEYKSKLTQGDLAPSTHALPFLAPFSPLLTLLPKLPHPHQSHPTLAYPPQCHCLPQIVTTTALSQTPYKSAEDLLILRCEPPMNLAFPGDICFKRGTGLN